MDSAPAPLNHMTFNQSARRLFERVDSAPHVEAEDATVAWCMGVWRRAHICRIDASERTGRSPTSVELGDIILRALRSGRRTAQQLMLERGSGALIRGSGATGGRDPFLTPAVALELGLHARATRLKAGSWLPDRQWDGLVTADPAASVDRIPAFAALAQALVVLALDHRDPALCTKRGFGVDVALASAVEALVVAERGQERAQGNRRRDPRKPTEALNILIREALEAHPDPDRPHVGALRERNNSDGARYLLKHYPKTVKEGIRFRKTTKKEAQDLEKVLTERIRRERKQLQRPSALVGRPRSRKP